MRHFSTLEKEIKREGGSIVKTIDDSVMASFQRPSSGLRAVLAVQEKLADPPDGEQSLVIKAGIHVGPCICVKFDDRFHYFGTTVNVAARLQDLSTGRDVVISSAVCENPEISGLLCQSEGNKDEIMAEPDTVVLKGFDQARFSVCRVSRLGKRRACESV